MYFDASHFSFCFAFCWKILSPAARCRTSAVCFLSFYISFLSFCACCRRFLPWTWWMGGHETISVCAADKTSKLCMRHALADAFGRGNVMCWQKDSGCISNKSHGLYQMFSFYNSVTGLQCYLPALSRPFCCFCLNSLSEPFGTGRLVSVPSTAHFVKQKQQKIRFLCLSDSVAQLTVSNWMELDFCEGGVPDPSTSSGKKNTKAAAGVTYVTFLICPVTVVAKQRV